MARGSWRRRWPAPGSRRSSALAVVLGEQAGVDHGHVRVVLAVEHQQRPGRQAAGGGQGAEAAELAGPRLEGGRKGRMADRAQLAGVLQEPARMRGPVVEVGPSRRASPRRAPGRPRRPTHTASEPPVLVPTSQMPSGAASVSRWPIEARQVVDPTLQREVAAGLTAAPEREREGGPPQLVGDAVHQLGERAAGLAGVERPEREPVAEDQPRQSLRRPAGRVGEVAGEGEAAGREPAVHRRAAGQRGRRRRGCRPARARR